jgi:hypothetical protein
MSTGQKEATAREWHENAAGRPYGNLEMKGLWPCFVRESQPSNLLALGVKQARRDHGKNEVAHGEPSERY